MQSFDEEQQRVVAQPRIRMCGECGGSQFHRADQQRQHSGKRAGGNALAQARNQQHGTENLDGAGNGERCLHDIEKAQVDGGHHHRYLQSDAGDLGNDQADGAVDGKACYAPFQIRALRQQMRKRTQQENQEQDAA